MKRKLDSAHPLGYFLKSAREDMDLTQIAVMKLTGINSKTLSGYENGIAEPDFQTLATLAQLYNISFDEILGINAEPKKYDFTLNKNEQNMLKLFRELPEEKQTECIVQLKALVRFLKKEQK